MKYIEKLRDPRWQKKRLEIFTRDSWKCQICGETEKTLHLHHKYYLPGKEPWEAPAQSLITLCLECHETEEQAKHLQNRFLCAWLDFGFTNQDFNFTFIGEDTKLTKQQIEEFFYLIDQEEFTDKLIELMAQFKKPWER